MRSRTVSVAYPQSVGVDDASGTGFLPRGKWLLAQMYRCVMRDAHVNDGTRFTGAHVAKVVWPDAIADGVGGVPTIGWG